MSLKRMYCFFRRKNKNNKNNYIKFYFIFFITLFVILTPLFIYFNSNKSKEALTLNNNSLYIENSVRNIFNIDYKKDYFNDLKISDNISESDVVVSNSIKSNFDVVDYFNKNYVLVVSWQNYDIDNINYDDVINLIKNGKAEINNHYFEFTYFEPYKKYYSDLSKVDANKFSYKNKSNFSYYIDNKSFISLIDVEDMEPYFKYIKVDNLSPFYGKAEDYKLSELYYLQKDNNIPEDLIDSLKLDIENYKNHSIITNILSVGDIMLSRDVGIKIRKSGDNSLPFRKLYSFLGDADITFGNLESPFYDKGAPLDIGMSFKADPKYIEGINLSGFDVLSLANNHFGNQGREGMEYTFNFLLENNIKYCGAGVSFSEAHKAAVFEKQGKGFSFLSYNSIEPQSYAASSDSAGLAFISYDSKMVANMKEDIKRESDSGNFVFVSFHWGSEYTPAASKFQKDIADIAIKSGADVIVAQHPHVVQGFDFIDGKPVLYSLGNFVFDQMWSRHTREGMISKLYVLNNKVIAFDLNPVIIEDYNQPRMADDKESYLILKRVIDNSSIR